MLPAVAILIATFQGVKEVVDNPLINKSIDHLFEGRENTILCEVWHAIEDIFNAHPGATPAQVKPQIEDALAKAQTWYEGLSPDERVAAKALRPIVMAGEPAESGNIG